MIKYTNEQKEMAIELRKQGLTYQEIANKIGFKNLTTLHDICMKAGLPTKKISRNTYSIGQRFCQFVILKDVSPRITEKSCFTQWECKCDCGKLFIITTKQIKRGQQSCGCYKFNSMFRRILTDVQANIRKILRHYQTGAKNRGFCWELTEEQATKLLFSNCYYCNSLPSRTCNYLKYCKPIIVSGIDRKDNLKGYIVDNCVSCCKFCNRAKLDASQEEFEIWAKNFVINFKGIK